MHPEVVDNQPGACPICRMKLEPVRLDTAWSCPVHAVIASSDPGRCPICGRELVHVTMAVTWTCGDRPGIERLEPGECADGTAARIKYTPRPHGNHNPQHGGQFFMAPDNWHHVEGVYPSAGVFRLHVYDDFSKPVPTAQLRRISASVSTAEGTTPLTIAREPGLLEARLTRAALPAQMTAKVRFTPGSPEYRFDFTFAAYSASALPPAIVSGVGRTDEVRPKADATTANTATGELVEQLRQRTREIAATIDRGAFGEVYVPAFAAKDLALEIAGRASAMAATRRAALEGAVSRLVRAAWMLDEAADLGDRARITAAHERLVAALGEIEAALR
jgi:Heavy metal binding domain